jgi:hypothetical protein
MISELLNISIGSDFESVARWWISNNKNSVINVVCPATLWSIWKLRNALCFQGRTWPGVQEIWGRIASDLGQWRILSKDAASVILVEKARLLDVKRRELLRIAW